MNTHKLHLPFQIEDETTGLTEINGLLHAEEKGLRMEYQVKDAILGLIKGNAKHVTIPYQEIGDVIFKSGFWGTSLTLRFNSLDIASQVPQAKDGRIKMKVKRKDREIGQHMLSHLEEQLGIGKKELPGEGSPRPFYE